jgi:hypothetical protein
MVMINAPDESPPKESGKAKDKVKSKSSKAKAEVGTSPSPERQSRRIARPSWSPDFIKKVNTDGKVSYQQIKPHSKQIYHDDDVVMVDGGNAGEPLVTSGPDDMAFVDHPPALKRSNTARKSGGFFGSFFGGRNSQVVETEKERPRSTTLTDAEDQSLPIRTKTTRRKSRAVDADDFTTDAPAETDAEARRADRRAKRDAKDKAEEVERADREARRRERRDREKADLDARRSKAKDLAKREQEAEDQRREEKRSRRAAKEAKRGDESHNDEVKPSTDAEKRREERRRLREKLEADGAVDARASKEDRKKQFEEEEDDRRRRRETQKSTKDIDGNRKREKDRGLGRSGHKSKASALVEEYHQSRSGSSKGHLNHVADTGKTNSWVQEQVEDPPDLPPVEGTIMDGSNEKPRSAEEYSRKKDKYGDADAEGRRERRKSRKEKVEKTSASGGSDERQDKRSSRRYVNGDGDYPIMTFDGRPEMKRSESKRKSFLGGLF